MTLAPDYSTFRRFQWVPDPEFGTDSRFAVKKAKPLPHRNRGKSARHRAKLKAKHKRVRLRRSKGERSTYR